MGESLAHKRKNFSKIMKATRKTPKNHNLQFDENSSCQTLKIEPGELCTFHWQHTLHKFKSCQSQNHWNFHEVLPGSCPEVFSPPLIHAFPPNVCVPLGTISGSTLNFQFPENPPKLSERISTVTDPAWSGLGQVSGRHCSSGGHTLLDLLSGKRIKT